MADRRRARRGGTRQTPDAEPAEEVRARDQTEARPPASDSDEAERQLARAFVTLGPAVGLIAASVVGYVSGLGPAILVVAGTALLLTIGFFWASLRTLSGDAPLPEGVSPHRFWERAPAPERKRETLRALKDLEFEHSIGKIDDADYKELSSRYRDVAKSLMREMDEGLAPRRAQAEALVKNHLEKRLLDASETTHAREPLPTPHAEGAVGVATATRVPCAKCGVTNEPDAAFCKKCGSPLTAASPLSESADASV